MGLAGQGGQRQRDFLEAGPGVDDGRSLGFPFGVPGVGAGHGEAEVAFHPLQGCVPQPAGADLLVFDPRQFEPDSGSQSVVAAAGDRLAGAVAQQLFTGLHATLLGVMHVGSHAS